MITIPTPNQSRHDRTTYDTVTAVSYTDLWQPESAASRRLLFPFFLDASPAPAYTLLRPWEANVRANVIGSNQ